MTVKVNANHSPMHRLQFLMYAVNTPTDARYNIYNRIAELNYAHSVWMTDLITAGTLSDSIGCDTLDFCWVFIVSRLRPPRTGTISEDHIIYRIFDQPIQSNPVVYPINIDACLNKVCVEYAPNKNDVFEILDKTNNGINSDFNYDPSKKPNADPLYLFRKGEGGCFNFATYMTAMMHSIGIGVNCKTIVSGNITNTEVVIDLWRNTIYNRGYRLWTENNHGNNNFLYHMVTNYSGNIYDPALGVHEVWQGSSGYVDEVFRYYYTPACENNSPPSDPPGIWDWGADEIPTFYFPTSNSRDEFHPTCRYPR